MLNDKDTSDSKSGFARIIVCVWNSNLTRKLLASFCVFLALVTLGRPEGEDESLATKGNAYSGALLGHWDICRLR